LDVTGDPLLAVDEAGQLIFINHSAEDLLQIESEDYVHQSINVLSDQVSVLSPAVADAIHFPFNEAMISRQGKTDYFDFDFPAEKGRFCLLTMSQVDQEFYLIVFERNRSSAMNSSSTLSGTPDVLTLPEIIDEINRNVERTHVLGEYLQQITPEDLHKHRDLVDELGNFDNLINKLAGTISAPVDDESELQYREALVKVMQDCHYYWQKVTGESIIDLAEKSRIWSVSIDNGRLRTRSMNRYLSLDKLPSNPRWRQVARTAYFVLSKVSQDEEARKALENSVATLQEIVEQKALT
jgi:two-component system, sensor histidine kinase LadS